jgi:hypothetical protein
VSWLRTHNRQWYALAGLMLLAGLVVLSGTARDIAVVAAFFVFLGACIREVGFSMRDNPVSTHGATRLRGIATQMAIESSVRRTAKTRKKTARRAGDAY